MRGHISIMNNRYTAHRLITATGNLLVTMDKITGQTCPTTPFTLDHAARSCCRAFLVARSSAAAAALSRSCCAALSRCGMRHSEGRT